MTHLRFVAQREAGISHWVARGPAGMDVEWDARIINEIDDKLIAWQSLEGSTVSTAGSVNFRETPRGMRSSRQSAIRPAGREAWRGVRLGLWRGAEHSDS